MSGPRSREVLVGAGVVTPALTCAALSLAREQVSATNAVLVLVLVVVAVAAGGSRLAGVLAALSSVVWFDFFLTVPYHRFTIAARDDVETAALLTMVGLGVTEIVLWGRRQQAVSSRREGYLTGVVRAGAMVADGAAGRAATLDFIAAQITEVLGLDRCTFVAGPGGARPRLGPDGGVVRLGVVVDVDRTGFPTDDVVEVPVTRAGVVLGRFELVAATRVVWPTVEQRLVAVTLADQAAAVLGES